MASKGAVKMLNMDYLGCLEMDIGMHTGLWCIDLGPPCSWFGANCIANHRRHIYGASGDISNPKVRLANLIANNFVWLRILFRQTFALFHVVLRFLHTFYVRLLHCQLSFEFQPLSETKHTQGYRSSTHQRAEAGICPRWADSWLSFPRIIYENCIELLCCSQYC